MPLYLILALFFALVPRATAGEWKLALPGYTFEFPRDHYSHPDYKTEWWYFTGNLTDSTGRAFGYQLTFFRQGINPDIRTMGVKSRFLVPDFVFAHFAVSDLRNNRFHHAQRASRGAFAEAGTSQAMDNPRLAWIDQWQVTRTGDNRFQLKAVTGDVALELELTSEKPVVVHGRDGVSQKSAGLGQASHYYSFTRMKTSGALVLNGQKLDVNGLTWMDREWASSQLAANQTGWDWFSLQFDSGEELMLYQLRLNSGGADPQSSGTSIDKLGAALHLSRSEFTLQPTRWWKSPKSNASYPVAWNVEVPAQGISLELQAAMDNQELDAQPIRYWEGAIRFHGTLRGAPASGKGYLELTGYGGSLGRALR